MKKTSVVYVVSEIDKSLAFEWIAEFIDKENFELKFFLIGKRNSSLSVALKQLNIDVVEFALGSKISIAITFFKIFFNFLFSRPDVVHTHLFYANMIGLTSARLAGVKRRIFTRHHSMVHYDEYPNGLKWDKYLNAISTDIVAISENVKFILVNLDKADEKKITLVHHGFFIPYFQRVNDSTVQQMKKKYLQPTSGPVIGAISRYLEYKGILYIIEAFSELVKEYPKAHLVLANAFGYIKKEVDERLRALPAGSYTEIVFEEDLASLYKIFDVYVHVPVDEKREAFGQTYVEALAAGIPSVFTLSGIAPEFIKNGVNALVVPYRNSTAITTAIKSLLSDSNLRNDIVNHGKVSVNEFEFAIMIKKLEALYEK